nr:hypothetical protein [Tanacetum cinerariifolium]
MLCCLLLLLYDHGYSHLALAAPGGSMGWSSFSDSSSSSSDNEDSQIYRTRNKTPKSEAIGFNPLLAIAKTADTSTQESLRYILQGTTQAMLRHHDYCVSCYSSIIQMVDVKSNVKEAEKLFRNIYIKKALKMLASIRSSNMKAGQVLWTPQQDNDCLTVVKNIS